MVFIGFVLGTILGSFVKALSDRSLINKSFAGRSYCPQCHKKLAWYDLLPVFSYLLLRGRCRYCKKKIPLEYLLVEVVMGILVGFLFWQQFKNVQFTIYNFQFSIFIAELLLKTFFIVILATLFLTDLKKMFIPDRVVLPSIIIGIISSVILVLLRIGFLYQSLLQTEIGKLLLPPRSDYFQRHALLIAQPLFWAILTGILIAGFFFSLIIITRGKGMGGGDVKLGAFLGIMLGFPHAIVALFLAFLTGALFSIGLLVIGKKHFGQVIPFGPFLVIGSLLMLFWGNQILDWYMRLGR